MPKQSRCYRGRGYDEMFETCSNAGGTLSGQIIRATGEPIADVKFRIENSQLILEVAGEEYSSITGALSALAPEIATHDADGSEGSGNVANNVIGNYAILKHVIFGNRTMYEMVGGSPVTVNKSKVGSKPKKVKTEIKDPTNTPASGNLYDFFQRAPVVEIAKRLGGAEAFQSAIKGLTIRQFASKFNLTIA